MAKTALRKDIFREIKKTFARFVSILCIVGLGAGFFTGVKATVPSMHDTADRYFNEYSLMDFKLLSSAGFDDEDAEAVQAMPSVEEVMPSYSVHALAEDQNGSFVVEVHALPEERNGYAALNRPKLLNGRYPEAENECLVFLTPLHNKHKQYEVGEVITLLPEAGETDLDEVLSGREFTVTGIASSAQYFALEYGSSTVGDGSVSLVMYIPFESFTYERYTELYLRLPGHENFSSYDEEYEAAVAALSEELETLGELRYPLYISELKQELADAEAEFEEETADAEKELSDAEQELLDAEEKLADGEKELKDGWKEYEDGVLEAEKEFSDAEQKIADAEKELTDGWQQLADGKKELEENKLLAEEEFAKAEKELKDAKEQLDKGRKEYEDGLKQYEDGLAAFQSGLSQYESGAAALEQSKAELFSGKNTVAAAEAVLSAGTAFYGAYTGGGDTLGTYTALSSAAADLQTALGSSDPISQALAANSLGTAASYVEMLAGALLGGNTAMEPQFQMALGGVSQAVTAGNDAVTQMEDAIAEGEAELQAASAMMGSSALELQTAEKQLKEAEQQLVDGEKEYEEGLAQFLEEKADAERQFLEAEEELASAEEELKTGEQELVDAKAEYRSAKADAEAELADAKEKLLEAEAELLDGKEEYEEGLLEYEDGLLEYKEAVADGEAELLDARELLADLEEGQWYVFDRTDAISQYKEYTDDAARVDAIARIFPVFFLLVAALVCLTTMSRMVEEQRTQLGTYKALGYSKGTIAWKFLLYALLASSIGSALGQVIFINMVPRIIATGYQIMYKFPPLQISIPWQSVLLSTFISLACTVLVALITCMRELKLPAAQLMRPKTPKAGKKILLERWEFFWKRLDFSGKITARNLFRYKSRLFMTIIGIGGSMSLMVAGFGLQDSILPLTQMQFGHVCTYDAIIASTAEYDEEEAAALKENLLSDERITAAVVTGQLIGDATSKQSDKTVVDVNVFVPAEPEDLTSIINTYHYETSEILPLTDDEAFITQKMAEQLNAFEGDEIIFHTDDGDYTITVTAVLEHYLGHYIYLSPASYEKIFGEAPVYNSAVVKTDAEAVEAAGGEGEFTSHWLKKDSDILSITFVSDAAASFDNLVTSLNTVVLVLIICAGALAFIVVYNLTNINISERLREIATIKVLGFTHKETNLYIFRESIIMCIIGVFLGLFGGYGLTMFIVYTVEVDMAMFVRTVEWSSYLVSAGFTVGFTLLVNFLMSRKIRKISMVESLKAVE